MAQQDQQTTHELREKIRHLILRHEGCDFIFCPMNDLLSSLKELVRAEDDGRTIADLVPILDKESIEYLIGKK